MQCWPLGRHQIWEIGQKLPSPGGDECRHDDAALGAQGQRNPDPRGGNIIQPRGEEGSGSKDGSFLRSMIWTEGLAVLRGRQAHEREWKCWVWEMCWWRGVVILIPLLTLDPKADTWPFTQGLLLVLTLKRFFTQNYSWWIWVLSDLVYVGLFCHPSILPLDIAIPGTVTEDFLSPLCSSICVMLSALEN